MPLDFSRDGGTARLVATLVVLASACGEDEELTYHRDVAHLLAENCASCHSDRGVTLRFALAGYEDATYAAPVMAHMVEDREMPPWPLDNSGACRTWEGARWLDQEAIEAIDGWADSGAPEGDPGDAKTPEPTLPPELRHVDATLDPGAEFVPSVGAGAVRCFVVDPALPRDGFLTALEVRSSAAWGVEQVTLFALDSDEAEQEASDRDEADADAGYACFGSAGVAGSRLLVGWAWGARVLRLPEGTGIRLVGGRRLVMQVHYNLIAGSEPDRTNVDLEIEDLVEEASLLPVRADDLRLAPGLVSTETTAELAVPRGLQVLAVYPRMRLYGVDLLLEAAPGRGRDPPTCMADVDHWDFHGLQQLYRYTDALTLGEGDVLRIRCHHTTLGLTEAAVPGDDARSEECAAYLYVTEAR